MDTRQIAVIAIHNSNELFPALEAALTLRDESEVSCEVTLIVLGANNQAADSAREGLFRGAKGAAVIIDQMFESIDESTLISFFTNRLATQFDEIITSGQGVDCRPHNAHLLLRYKRAKIAAERDPKDRYDYLYATNPHLCIPSYNLTDGNFTQEEINELCSSLKYSASGDFIKGDGSTPIIINANSENGAWVEEIARIILDYRPSRLSRRLRDAQIVVGGGYGVGSEEGFERLGEFATEIRARLGATRAAVDAEFCPARLMIGPTGVRIHPKLYIACGISGQIQHMAGIAHGTAIISINTDPEAPISEIADYAIIGTVEDVLPRILECYKALQNR